MADTIIKKWNSTTSQWEELNPQTSHTQIVASGTPSSSTYLRGDGTWATVASGFNGGTITSNLEIQNSLPKINLTDTDNNSDYHIANNNGTLEIADTTNQASRIEISSTGNITLPSTGGITLVDKALQNSSGALLYDGDEIYHEGHKPTLAELGAAASSHTHDDRYYTETETNTLLAGKANTSHTHTFASLTSKPTTLSGYGITDAYTQTQVNSQISTAVSNLVDSSPATLDTLNELAAALGDDPNFATTMATALGGKMSTSHPANNITSTHLYMANGDGFVWNDTTNVMYVRKDGTDYEVIDSGNIGSQSVNYATSAGNAGTLDNIDSSQFLRSDVSDSVAAGRTIQFYSYNTIDTSSGSQASLEVYNGSAGNDAFMTFHIGGDYAAYLGLHGGINDFVVGGWSKGATYQRLFHDGYHPNADKLTTARNIALSGDVTGNANFDGSGNITISTAVANDSHTHDGRYYTESEVNTLLAGKQNAGTYNTIIGTDSDINTSGYSIVDNIYVTDGVITSMGTRSLDQFYVRDTRAGALLPNSYASRAVSAEFTDDINGAWWSALTVKGWDNGYAPWQLIGYSSTGSDNRLFFRNGNGSGNSWSGLQEVWHSGSDGSGSGLDADLLDGQQGSYYQPASSAITTSNIGSQSVNYANTSGWADQVDVNYSTSASYYNVLWHSGDTVYYAGNNKFRVQPSTGNLQIGGNNVWHGGNLTFSLSSNTLTITTS